MIIETRYELEFRSFGPLEEAMSKFVPDAASRGWSLIAAMKHLTGNICLATQIWEAAEPQAGSAPDFAPVSPHLDPAYAPLADVVRSERIERLEPLSYHPENRLPAKAGAFFQRVIFDLEPGNLGQFEASMAVVVPGLTAGGMELVAALRRSSGAVDYAFNLWRIESPETMVTAGPAARAANPDLPAAVVPLEQIIRSETIDLLAPLSHHPG